MDQSLLDLLRLDADEADVVLAPSGTDAELLTVLVSLAEPGAALTNVVVSPHETGTGVREAAEGRYFDPIAATGAPIKKGQAAWPGRDIVMVEVGIRDSHGVPLPKGAVIDAMRKETERALAAGRRVLVHVLASSKTGQSRPREEVVDALVALAPDRIDVVVDACQMRARFEHVGEWVRRGWMVQITGSKFLTGPPFSGALVIPARLRSRAAEVRKLLEAAPGAGSPRDWNAWWRERLAPVDEGTPSFGSIFRWLPAVLEAKLLEALPHPLLTYGFDRFRAAISERLAQSEWLISTDDGLGAPTPARADYPDLATSSIVSFTVATVDWDGRKRRLQENECRRIFQLLNLDVADQLGRLSSTEESIARLEAHVGQPVVLARDADGDQTVLRMVLGARFFNIIGHAGPGSVEAALESEIADAQRALDKLELLASRWTRLRRHMMT